MQPLLLRIARATTLAALSLLVLAVVDPSRAEASCGDYVTVRGVLMNGHKTVIFK